MWWAHGLAHGLEPLLRDTHRVLVEISRGTNALLRDSEDPEVATDERRGLWIAWASTFNATKRTHGIMGLPPQAS
jgi:hypothetical protein